MLNFQVTMSSLIHWNYTYLLITASPPLDPIRSQWNHIYLSLIILIFHSTCVTHLNIRNVALRPVVQGGSNMTGTDLCVNKPHCAAAVRP